MVTDLPKSINFFAVHVLRKEATGYPAPIQPNRPFRSNISTKRLERLDRRLSCTLAQDGFRVGLNIWNHWNFWNGWNYLRVFNGLNRAKRLNVLNMFSLEWNVWNGPQYFSRECPAETIRSESHARDRLVSQARRLSPPPRGTERPADCRARSR
jgi:hypothetical protein